MSKGAVFFMTLSAFLLGIIIGGGLKDGGVLCGNIIARSVKVRGVTARNKFERTNENG